MPTDIETGGAMVCDEVRREDNGKLILIGVYSSNIVAAELPATLLLSLVLKVEAAAPVEEGMDIKVALDGKELRTGKGRIKLQASAPTWIVVPSILVDKIDREGRLEFLVKFGDGVWQTACWLPLTVRKSATVLATEPSLPS